MRHRHIFSAVFPTSAYTSTQPTPLATPETQFVSVGQSFGGGQDGRPSEHYKASSDPVTQQIYWDRAWHSATSLLSLPKEHISFHEPSQIGGLHERWNKARLSPASSGAIRHVLRPRNDRTPHNEDIYDASLVDWYGNEVRRHFLAFVGPDLCGVCGITLLFSNSLLIFSRSSRTSNLKMHSIGLSRRYRMHKAYISSPWSTTSFLSWRLSMIQLRTARSRNRYVSRRKVSDFDSKEM